MNNSKKEALRNTLIAGTINVETFEKIKLEIFEECSMSNTSSKDRALWSIWINAKSTPNRFCQKSINTVLKRNNLSPIYDETTDN